MAEMILTFEWDGKTVHKETKGFTGKDCISKTKRFEDALGNPGERKLKSEFYEEVHEEEHDEEQRLRY